MSIDTVKPGVKTNLITGFLGAGKTTCILQLLQQKSSQERWAILVNEFGEIGIDGSLLQRAATGEVFIKEVAGGCICCTMGLPMQVALNQLLARSKPDRLLIELTGLGHARDVLKLLSQPWYRKLLHLHASVAVIDGRESVFSRLSTSTIFRAQLAQADIYLINKADLASDQDRQYIKAALHDIRPHPRLHYTEQGAMPAEWLDLPSSCHNMTPDSPTNDAAQASLPATSESESELPECGFLRSEQQSDGYHTAGWRFAGHFQFNHDAIINLIESLDPLRLKAIINTERGCLVVNMAENSLQTASRPDSAPESRLEVIDGHPVMAGQLHEQLMSAAVDKSGKRG